MNTDILGTWSYSCFCVLKFLLFHVPAFFLFTCVLLLAVSASCSKFITLCCCSRSYIFFNHYFCVFFILATLFVLVSLRCLVNHFLFFCKISLVYFVLLLVSNNSVSTRRILFSYCLWYLAEVSVKQSGLQEFSQKSKFYFDQVIIGASTWLIFVHILWNSFVYWLHWW